MDAAKTTIFIGVMTLAGFGGAAMAQDTGLKGTWQVTARLTTVAPDESGAIVTAAGADSGLDVAVNDSTVPTLGFTYFVTDHVAVEAILGTSKHTIKAVGTGTDVAVHETWVLPPVVTAQYHFNTGGKVSPYVGAGINYMNWYGGKDLNGFKVRLKNSVGTAIQAGANVRLKENLVLNIDYKKVFYGTDARINNGALKSEVTLDPSVISVGLGYRF
ncbi:OmpW/AlkL family protein [Asticcacaulis sp. AC460]|uniref:OmpW/AlkL family protein n=1 Tax=Asticcacaulis sp. AC460 TaxID=1282360 RepID=UPI0004CE25C3